MNRLDSYTPLGLLAVRRRDRGRAGRRGVHGRPARRGAPATSTRCTPRSTGSRSTCACPCPTGVAPEHAAFATVGAIAMQGVRRAEVAARRDRRASSASGLVGQLVVRLLVAAGRPGGRPRHGRGPLPRWPRRPARSLRGRPTPRAWPRSSRHWLEITGGARRRPRLPGRRRVVQRPGRDRGAAGPGPRPGRRHRQDASSTCRGTPTTRRSSTSGSPGPTGPAATTTATSSRASTTRPATSAGPSGATWSASSTCSPATSSRSEPLVSGVFPMADARRRSTATWPGRAHGRRLPARVPGSPPRTPAAAGHQPAGHGPRPATGRPAGTGRRRSQSASSARATTPRSMLLPHLARLADAQLAHVATTRSLSAVNAQRKFGFTTASTDADAVLERRRRWTRSSS